MLRGVASSLHVVHMGEKRITYEILVQTLKERSHLQDIGVDGSIMLLLLRQIGRAGKTGFRCLRTRLNGGFL
jgi:hypothetical protein